MIDNAYGGERPEAQQPKIRKLILSRGIGEDYEFERREDGEWWCGEVRVSGR